ncbi:MAG TPA: hypothetical protein VLA39_07105 [Marinobacterium sp.]|nr:hypothetical protein [Marinobacterium sp.]
MSDLRLDLDTHLYDQLDMPALQRAFKIQLPLVERLGSLRASIIGMHIYQFALSENAAYVDRVLLLLQEYKAKGPEAMTMELVRAAQLRSEYRPTDWLIIYRHEAEHLLLLAALCQPWHPRLEQALRQYQLYACSHLLGATNRPAFLQHSDIETLLRPNNGQPVNLFTRQFSERLRKPELIARELATHFAAINP